MKTEIKVIDAMTKNPVMVGPETSISECARIMSERKVGSLLITEGKNLLGVIKERDIVRSVVLENKNAEKELVKDFMITDVITTTPNEDIYDAIVTMRDMDIRMLPVMHNGELTGLLTAKDILKVQPSLFDLLAEKLILREEDEKPIFKRRDY